MIMRKLIEKLGVVGVGFIVMIWIVSICSLCTISAIESLEDTIRETNEPVQTITYEETNEVSEEIVYVTYEKQEDGDMIYDFGDVSNDYYFYIIINEEQGIYEYYYPAMHIDWPIECDSLAELQDVIMCHIDQAYPNARFVMR